MRKTYGTQKTAEWGLAVLASLQQAKILRQGMHESSVSGETEKRGELGDYSPIRPDEVAEWMLRDLRKRQECGCSSQGWESSQQRHNEPTEALPELPYESASGIQDLHNMWEKGEGLWLLREALSEIQKIWESADGKWEGGDGMNDVRMTVRRLTPL